MLDSDEKKDEDGEASVRPRTNDVLQPGQLWKSVVLKHLGVLFVGLIMGQSWFVLPQHLVVILFGEDAD